MPPHSARASGRQSAFARHFARLGGQGGRRHVDGIGQQLQGFRFGEERDGNQFAVEGVENALVAGGDEHPAARAEHVEGLGIGRPPDVVEHEQDGLGGEQLAEHALSLRQRGEACRRRRGAGPGRAGA